MKKLYNFNIISGIQNFIALLKSKEMFLPVQHLRAVKCAVAVILCVALDTETQIICPKEPYLLDHVQKPYH